LYATGPVFAVCRRYGWKYMITLTDDQLTSVNEEFESLAAATPANRLTWVTGKDRSIRSQSRIHDVGALSCSCSCSCSCS
jgi:hypothetical protein